MESTRIKKISRLIQKELAEIFQREGRSLYQGKMITVTVVRVSPDLSTARVYLSIFPQDKNNEVLDMVHENKGHIKNELGGRIKNQLRKIPDLTFYVDDSLDYIDKIDNLLKS